MKGRRIIDFIKLWSIAGSVGLEICVSSTSFQKKYIGWPQQPPTEIKSNLGTLKDVFPDQQSKNFLQIKFKWDLPKVFHFKRVIKVYKHT